MVKRENVQKMDPKFRVLSTAKIIVSPQRHAHLLLKKMRFYEHGFQSCGMFVYSQQLKSMYNSKPQITTSFKPWSCLELCVFCDGVAMFGDALGVLGILLRPRSLRLRIMPFSSALGPTKRIESINVPFGNLTYSYGESQFLMETTHDFNGHVQ